MEREGIRQQRPAPRRGTGPLTPRSDAPPIIKRRRGWPRPAEAWEALRAGFRLVRDALDPRSNPFLATELRIQARRRALPRHLLLHALALALWFFGLLWLSRVQWNDYVPIERFLSQHLVTGLAAVHAWMVIHASNSRVREAAQREETARMWEMLLATPLSPARIVLFKSVYPALYASLIALLGLPIYLLAAAISGISFGLLAMLYVVYGLVTVRLVAPLRPPRAGHGRRRARHAAGSFGPYFAWFWFALLFGRGLTALSPLAPLMVITWPIVVAQVLPTAYPFFRWSLPPFVPLLALAVPLFVLSLRWATRRLLTQATEAPDVEPVSLLRRAVVVATAVIAVGYAWPTLIVGGRLGSLLAVGSTPSASLIGLAWLLLGTWWLVFGIGSLVTPRDPHADPSDSRLSRQESGWLGNVTTARGMWMGAAGLLAMPAAVWALSCLLGGRMPAPADLSWLLRIVAVAAGAAILTAVLARRFQVTALSDRPVRLLAAWFLAAAIFLAPLLLLFWFDSGEAWPAAISPVIGFFLALHSGNDASQLVVPVQTMTPWWVTPVLNLGIAALLSLRRDPAETPRRAAAAPSQRRRIRWLSRPIEQLAARWDQPVLIKELRAGARGSDWQQLLSKMALIAIVPAVLSCFSQEIIPAIATELPIRLVPAELERPGLPPSSQLFAASIVALLVACLGLPMVFSSPGLGAGTFSQERRKGTLGFLLLTPLSEVKVVRGKLLGAVAPLLLALGVSFPIAALAALFSLSPDVLWTFLFGYAWLVVACLTGGAFGLVASLLLPADNDPQLPPGLVMLALQGFKLYLAARLQYMLLPSTSWSGLEITAWYVIPLVVAEALCGYLAYSASISLLARARHQDLRFVTEK